jgi:hypothetical protein
MNEIVKMANLPTTTYTEKDISYKIIMPKPPKAKRLKRE